MYRGVSSDATRPGRGRLACRWSMRGSGSFHRGAARGGWQYGATPSRFAPAQNGSRNVDPCWTPFAPHNSVRSPYRPADGPRYAPRGPPFVRGPPPSHPPPPPPSMFGGGGCGGCAARSLQIDAGGGHDGEEAAAGTGVRAAAAVGPLSSIAASSSSPPSPSPLGSALPSTRSQDETRQVQLKMVKMMARESYGGAASYSDAFGGPPSINDRATYHAVLAAMGQLAFGQSSARAMKKRVRAYSGLTFPVGMPPWAHVTIGARTDFSDVGALDVKRQCPTTEPWLVIAGVVWTQDATGRVHKGPAESQLLFMLGPRLRVLVYDRRTSEMYLAARDAEELALRGLGMVSALYSAEYLDAYLPASVEPFETALLLSDMQRNPPYLQRLVAQYRCVDVTIPVPYRDQPVVLKIMDRWEGLRSFFPFCDEHHGPQITRDVQRIVEEQCQASVTLLGAVGAYGGKDGSFCCMAVVFCDHKGRVRGYRTADGEICGLADDMLQFFRMGTLRCLLPGNTYLKEESSKSAARCLPPTDYGFWACPRDRFQQLFTANHDALDGERMVQLVDTDERYDENVLYEQSQRMWDLCLPSSLGYVYLTDEWVWLGDRGHVRPDGTIPDPDELCGKIRSINISSDEECS
uniref:Gp145 n=1 Tax=Caviid herpesvirus 2 str. CIDMTR TaxID=1415526 RepID=U6H8J4_9BETA|nr:gp145 [Caviid herpesvirus 2 str. CIDMTR]